jgi:TonB family protein
MLIMAFFVITTSEKLSDCVQVEWVKMSRPKSKQRQMLRKRIIAKLEASPVPSTSDTLSQKFPPVWTAASPETYHQGESIFLSPMPSAPATDSSFIPSNRVDFREVNNSPTLIKSQKALSLSRVEPKREGLPKLSSMLESMTPIAAAPSLTELSLQDVLSPYLKEVREKIERVKKYPDAAKEFGIEGTVHIKFTILSNGKVERVEVARSSGYETLDEAAVWAIKTATPFPPFPKAIRRESLQIEVPLVFKLLEPE